MYFLQKVFQLRDKANPSAEKPFLEHLEDLRVCITRITLTLLCATVVCFIFRSQLMDIIRRPVTEVYETTLAEALKKSKITPDIWEKAKTIATPVLFQNEAQRSHTIEWHGGKDAALLKHAIDAIGHYQACRPLDSADKRTKFFKEYPGIDEEMRTTLLSLVEGAPNADIDARGKMVLMQTLKPTESFMLSIKLAFFAGMVISFPFLLYYILQFVLPGMHEAERKALWPAMAIGFALFLCGVFFAYFVVMPRVLEFFHSYSAQMSIRNEWRIGYYVSFATQFTLIFGLSFELPVIVMTLVKLDILNSQMMRSTRSYAILAIFVIAAIITPTPDAFTLCLLAGPMVILYEICIWLAVFLERKKRRIEEEEEKVRMAALLARRAERAERGDDSDDDDKPDGDGPDGDGPGDGGDDHGPDHDPGGMGQGHDDYHDHDHDYDHDHHHDEYHDEHHGESHDRDDHLDHDYHPEHGDHDDLHEGELGHGDDGHTGADQSDPPSGDKQSGDDKPDPEKPNLEQPGFDFHEETDPALTEEGEQEDISDPWPEEDDHVDPHNPPEDIPDEERDRGDGDPDKRDTD